MTEALSKANSLIEAKEVETEEPALEPEPEAEGVETLEADTDTDTEAEEPQQSDEGPQILGDEYDDVLVAFNGKETSLSELKAGNLRQADYSRKTQDLAKERKDLMADIDKQKADLADREQRLAQQLVDTEGSEPDWVKLADEDPLGYASAKARWDAKIRLRDERNQENQKRQDSARRQFIAETATIAVDRFPEWNDVKNFDKGAEARKAQALAAGFTVQEYDSTPDYRIAVILEKAARYDALESKQKITASAADKKIAAAPKVLRPGQSRGDVDPQTERRAAFQKRLSRPISFDEIKKSIGR
jgi:hypothetical protein